VAEPESEQDYSIGFEQDPRSAIPSRPDQHRGGWLLDEFFSTGRDEVDQALAALAERGIAVGTGRALDFGCRIGHLTRALAEHFDACDGVDSAVPLIEQARELGGYGDRVRFHEMTAHDLSMFGDASFDFVLAPTGLRRIEPELIAGYLREFVRVLRPGGVAFFNLPERFVCAQKLPREAVRARLTMTGSLSTLAPGEVFPLSLKVHNDSPVPWAASAQLQVAERWRAANGDTVAIDATGAWIQTAVNPGGNCDVRVWVLAPRAPGEYELEVDLFQEKFGWFADGGSNPLKMRVDVIPYVSRTASVSAAAVAERLIRLSEQAESVPPGQGHAVAREEVVAMVADAGGLLIAWETKDRAGPSMPGLDYVVARATAPVRGRSGVENRDRRAEIEARIRRALTYGAGSRALSERLVAADPGGAERSRAALEFMDDRADLVGFEMSSRLKGLGRASTLVREGLRRILLQVLFRQTEFNRLSSQVIRRHEAQLEVLGATVRAQLAIQAGAEERTEALERRLQRVEVTSAGMARRARPAPARATLRDVDTLSFAERFHGTAQERRERLSRYLPRFEGRSEVVDAGCGRGEFLGLLQEAGIAAIGIDSDEAMVAWCRQLGLNAIQADVLHYFRGRPEESLDGIFGAHLIEHLKRGEVVELMRLAFSLLRPGGALMLEAVNPLCLSAYPGFYCDVTGGAPAPPAALQWLAESCGFDSVAIEYSSPIPPEQKLRPLPASAGGRAEVEAFNRGIAAVNELLFGFQEYTLTALKPD
jgi:SAM-dependent methyltransferase